MNRFEGEGHREEPSNLSEVMNHPLVRHEVELLFHNSTAAPKDVPVSQEFISVCEELVLAVKPLVEKDVHELKPDPSSPGFKEVFADKAVGRLDPELSDRSSQMSILRDKLLAIALREEKKRFPGQESMTERMFDHGFEHMISIIAQVETMIILKMDPELLRLDSAEQREAQLESLQAATDSEMASGDILTGKEDPDEVIDEIFGEDQDGDEENDNGKKETIN